MKINALLAVKTANRLNLAACDQSCNYAMNQSLRTVNNKILIPHTPEADGRERDNEEDQAGNGRGHHGSYAS